MEKYRDIMGRINYGVFLAAVALLPFPQIALRYAIVIWGITWLLEGRWLGKPSFHIDRSTSSIQLPFLLFGVWLAWKALSGFWAADQGTWAWQMERYLTFACIIPIGIWGVNDRYDWRTAGKVLAWSCVVATPVYAVLMTTLHYHREIIDLLQWKADWDYSGTDWYTFVTTNISCVKHRLFLCSVALTGVVMAVQVWREQKLKLAILLPVMLAIIPLTGSRQSIVTGMVLLVIAVIYVLPQKHRLRYGIAVVLCGALLGGGLLKFHPRMYEGNESDTIRRDVWTLALQQPSDYLLTGLGAGQSTSYLVERYHEAGLEHYAKKRIHVHNQYMEELIEIGVFGLLLFVLAWIAVPLCSKGKGHRTAVMLTTIFMLNMLTDCMFGTFDGIALWAAGMILVLVQERNSTDAQSPPSRIA